MEVLHEAAYPLSCLITFLRRVLYSDICLHGLKYVKIPRLSVADRYKLPRLFLNENNPSCSVADRYKTEDNNRYFVGNWRRKLFVWEEDLLIDLQQTAGNFLKSDINEDKWRWSRTSSGIYTMKSAYVVITEMNSEVNNQTTKLGIVWNTVVPLKIAAFTWKVLQDRIPSMLNLLKRGAYHPNFSTNCKLCDLDSEDTQHLFFDCKASKTIWYCIYW
ncbi:hypothetical protein ACS0TY_004751 [Phlomoides rotata]